MSLINIYVMVVFVVLPLICVDLNKEKFTVFFFFHYNTKNIYCILLRFWIERMRIKKKLVHCLNALQRIRRIMQLIQIIIKNMQNILMLLKIGLSLCEISIGFPGEILLFS